MLSISARTLTPKMLLLILRFRTVEMCQLAGTTHHGGYNHDSIVYALKECGYRHIDTAKRYGEAGTKTRAFCLVKAVFLCRIPS
jgi:hypothetical protein